MHGYVVPSRIGTLPVPPYNWNSAFILEKNPCKNKYVKILELINKVKKKSSG